MFSLEENFKKYSFKFSCCSVNRTTTFRSVTHLVVECFIAYSETMFVTSPINLSSALRPADNLKKKYILSAYWPTSKFKAATHLRKEF